MVSIFGIALRRLTMAMALGALGLATSGLARAEPVAMTESEFKAYHDYLDALHDPRVEKLKAAKRLPAIARNFGMPVSQLKRIIAKGERYPDLTEVGRQSEAAIHEALEGTDLASRLGEVKVDTSDSHVVTYVSWREAKPEALEQEACLIAVRARKAAPITADLRLWAVDPQNPDHKAFDGMITGEAAARIQETRIPDFAQTRYIKLFEKVHLDRPGE
ncbi:MAG: hypothetical protein ACYCWW_13790 [Deltaproteobacteria bacterium]